jgi:hypothetical protein
MDVLESTLSPSDPYHIYSTKIGEFIYCTQEKKYLFSRFCIYHLFILSLEVINYKKHHENIGTIRQGFIDSKDKVDTINRKIGVREQIRSISRFKRIS